MEFSKKTKCRLKIWKDLIDLPKATEITVLLLAMMEGWNARSGFQMRRRSFSKDSLVSIVHVWTMNQIKASVNLQRDIWYFQMHNNNHKSIFKHFQFSDNWKKIPYNSVGQGKWELFLPPKQDGNCPLPHLTELKVGTFLNRQLLYIVVWKLTEAKKQA